MISKQIKGYEFRYDTENNILYKFNKVKKQFITCHNYVKDKEGIQRVGLTMPNGKTKSIQVNRVIKKMLDDDFNLEKFERNE